MMKEWYVHYDLLLVMIAAGMAIIALQCVAGWLLGRLYRDSSRISTTDNPWLRGIIKRYEAGYQLRVPMNDAPSFVDRNIAEYRFRGLSLEQWADVGVYGAWLECILMGISTLAGVYYKTSLYTFGIYGIYMILILAVIMGCEFILQIHTHQKGIRVYILDYIENTLRPRLENRYLHPEEQEAYQKEYFIEDPAASGEAAIPAASGQSPVPGFSQDEKEALLTEVLEEYF